MAKASVAPEWQRALIVLTSTMVGVVVIGGLYWAQAVFIPVAMAIFLAFLLAPLVTIAERRGLGRTPSVAIVVLLATMAMGGLLWFLAAELTSLVGDLPSYTENIKAKVRSLRGMTSNSVVDRLEKMVHDITGEWRTQVTPPPEAGAADQTGDAAGSANKPPPIVVQQQGSPWLTRLPAVLAFVGSSLGAMALALVLVVFMLLKREDLRNRLIRLVGHGRLTVMTKALDDAGQRISRYLLMQFIINGCYGAVLTIGLLVIGMPHAFLWGLLTAVLRYVPYIGLWLTAAFLLTLSLAVFPGWAQPLMILALIAILELTTYNIVEPLLFGQSTGISPVAQLVSAACWAFIWGPIGLVLSNPLTVCLVVLGKYIPQLEFLDVLLGDEPVLESDVSYYQRLLARDQDEATQLVLTHAKSESAEQIFDELLVPALNYTKRDLERDDITEADEQFVLRQTREIVTDLGENPAVVTAATSEPDKTPGMHPTAKVRLVACPCHDEADGLALEMLRQLLDPAKWEVQILSVEMLSAEVVALVGEKAPGVICIAALPPGGLARTRYLCKRLRARLPNAKILVGRWGLKGNLEQNEEQLREAGADRVETTLLKSRDYLNEWLPVLTQQETKADSESPAKKRLSVAG